MVEVEVQVNTQEYRGDTACWAADLSAEQQPSLSQQTFTLFHVVLSKCDIVKLIKAVDLLKLAGFEPPPARGKKKKKKGATKYLSLSLLLYWLSTQKHTPAHPRSSLPLKYESFFPSCALDTTHKLKWIFSITIQSFTVFLWPLQCSSGSRDSSSRFLCLGNRKKVLLSDG